MITVIACRHHLRRDIGPFLTYDGAVSQAKSLESDGYRVTYWDEYGNQLHDDGFGLHLKRHPNRPIAYVATTHRRTEK
jgi:hypothetical protein